MAGLGTCGRRGPAARTLGLPAVLVGVLLLGAGCSGGDDQPEQPDADPSAPMTEIAVECDRFADTTQRLADAQTALYDGKDSPEDATAVDDLVTELEALEEQAPDEVDEALAGLADGFRSAQELLADPTPANLGELSTLATSLGEDSQAVTTWILSQCEG